MERSTFVAALSAALLLIVSSGIAAGLDCPRSLGCGVVGCKCGDTVVSNFTMKSDITCPQTFTDPVFGLKVNPGVTLDGKNPTTGQIHKIIGPGNPDTGHPNVDDDNVGIWLLPNTVGGVTQPITVQNVDVSGFNRGVQIRTGSNGNTLLNVAAHDNGNFLVANARGYGIDVLGSDNLIDGCQVYHNGDEGIHFSSSVSEGSTSVPGTCSASGAGCTRDAECPVDQTCDVVNGARNKVRSTVPDASQVYDNGVENIYVRITSKTTIWDTLSSFPGRCACSGTSGCGTGGLCGSTGTWLGRCIKGTPTECTTSLDCPGTACRHGAGTSARALYVKHSVDGNYRRNVFGDATVQVIGNSRDNVFGRPNAAGGGNVLANADLKLTEHPEDGGFPSGTRIRYGNIDFPSGPCITVQASSVNTIDHVDFLSCPVHIQSSGFCQLNPSKDCAANGADCVAQCDPVTSGECGEEGVTCTCEQTGVMCSANGGCGCVGGICMDDPSPTPRTCTTHTDCRLCEADLPNGPNEVCNTTPWPPVVSPAPPAPASVVLNPATCP